MTNITNFQEKYPSIDTYWRSVILFGRNVASYKFALAKSLLDIVPIGTTEISLEELAKPFANNICEHLKTHPKQATSNSSQFLDTCRKYNNSEINYDELIATTVKKGFNNVIDAFHIVGDRELPLSFYEKEYSSTKKKIILTDEIFKLRDIVNYNNFMNETEARWNLVETAWDIGVSRYLLNVKYDEQNKSLFVDNQLRRKDVTSARDALNGYQKGKCFYCFDNISIEKGNESLCDVDHFYPHTLLKATTGINLNGVWNLVLACPRCNRGTNGKFASIPELEYLRRLHRRNEYLICSHHPLRETLISQTGQTEEERIKFLNEIDKVACEAFHYRWKTIQIGDETF